MKPPPKGMAPTLALPAPRRRPLGHRRSALGRVIRIRRTIPSRRIRGSRMPPGRLSFIRQPPMELVSVRIEESPHAAGRVRLVGDVAYDDRPGTEAYWFEVDEEHAGALSLSGYALARLPAPAGGDARAEAASGRSRRSAPRRQRAPPDGDLENLVPEAVSPPACRGNRSGAREGAPRPRGAAEDRSVFLRRHRLLLHDPAQRRARRPIGVSQDRQPPLGRRIRPPARVVRGGVRPAPVPSFGRRSGAGMGFLDVRTNLRTTRFREASWGHVAHGCALASVGLALEGLFQTIYIAATRDPGGFAHGDRIPKRIRCSRRDPPGSSTTKWGHGGSSRPSESPDPTSRCERCTCAFAPAPRTIAATAASACSRC